MDKIQEFWYCVSNQDQLPIYKLDEINCSQSCSMLINFIKDYLNLDVLCIEVIQGLADSIGIILTVPITAFIASYFCKLNLKKV